MKSRLANHIAQILAILVIVGGWYVWSTYIAPVGSSTRAEPEQPAAAVEAATATKENPAPADGTPHE